VECTTWMTEERFGASAAGAPRVGLSASMAAVRLQNQIQKRAGFVPPAYGPGLVRGSATVVFHSNDHVATGRTAWYSMPLGSPGAGNG